MTHVRSTLLGAVLASSLTLPALAGCGLLDGSSRLEDALEYLPAESEDVRFVDRAAVAARLDVDDVEHGDDPAEYIDAVTDARAPTTALGQYLASMDDAAFSELDVEWEATATMPDGPPARVWRLREDLDLEDVADDLVDAGWRETGSEDGVRRLSIDLQDAGETGLVDGRYPLVELMDIAVVPDEDLVVTAPATDVVTGEEESLAAGGGFDDLLETADHDEVEFGWLARGERACPDTDWLSPEQREQRAQLYDGIGSPEASGAFTRGAAPGETVLLFADGPAADADAEGRADYLEAFATMHDLPGDFDVEADGEVVRVAHEPDLDDVVVRSVPRTEGPVFCLPDA